MKFIVLLMALFVAYFVWDGFVTRQLDPSSLSGGAKVVTEAQVQPRQYPLEQFTYFGSLTR